MSRIEGIQRLAIKFIPSLVPGEMSSGPAVVKGGKGKWLLECRFEIRVIVDKSDRDS